MHSLFTCVLRLLLMLSLTAESVFGQQNCLSIYGAIIDQSTKQPVANANLYVRVDGERKPLGQSLKNGNYHVPIPCNAKSLIAGATGYQNLELPIGDFGLVFEKESFYIPLPLVPMDKQAVDRPYHQTEQKHYTIQNVKKNTASKKSVLRSILVTDAIDKQPIQAKVCLLYTKTGKTDCKEVQSAKKPWEVSFSEPDIVAIEVTATGYQKYQGNLILEEIDESRQVYEIKLNKELTVFSLIISNSDEKMNAVISSGKFSNQMARHNNSHHYTFVTPSAFSTVKVLSERGNILFQKNIVIKPGLNCDKIELPVTEGNISNAVVPDSAVIFFKQGSYELELVNKLKLDTLAKLMKVSPALRIRITGHTDNIGDPKINQALSEYRARVVRFYLLDKGIQEQRLNWEGVNSRFPALSNESEENKAKNRRVVLNLIHNN